MKLENNFNGYFLFIKNLTNVFILYSIYTLKEGLYGK